LKVFLRDVTDAAVRTWAPPLLHVVTQRDDPALRAWLTQLFTTGKPPIVDAPPENLKKFQTELANWQEKLLGGAEEPFRICFRLEPPESPEQGEETAIWNPLDAWTLRFFIQARDDPSLLVPASMVWREQSATLRYLDRRFENPQEKLLTGLGQAARFFPPLADSLRTTSPEASYLDTQQAYTFLRQAAPLLEQSGFGVLVPPWWEKRHRQLGVRATISPADTDGQGILNLDALVKFRWQVALGDQAIEPEEFSRLAALKLPLVQVRGEWVELQPEQVEKAIRFWEKQSAEEEVTLRRALQVGLSEEGETGALPIVDIETSGWIDDLMRQLRGNEHLEALPPPDGLTGQLRPYQERGYAWLDYLHRWGLGACLADDMGLGKTIQAICLILHDVEEKQVDEPVLVICPTSVVGNWAREIARFAPSLRTVIHHGGDRAQGTEFVEQIRQNEPAHIVISTYGLARRDEETLRQIDWAGIVLDEAQNIKNPATKQTQAIRRLKAGYKVALTGTPVENRLSELWSIMQFLNPGYLGSQQSFRTRFARPIERYQDSQATRRLRKLVQPFVMRRVKTDPSIIQDLPEKMENKVFCTLTPEQATLYQAVVQEALDQVEAAEGIQRRGLVLSMLTRLKQICNHPAQFLGDGSVLPDRSGKLARMGEMLEEVLSVDERALIFTQFAAMGTLLQAHLQELFGGEILFLYGGTPAKQRDRMIARFQEERHGPSIFILSLKAGGLGLNLTRANHVFHFDRWWNPAVENQATDRAFRIGQTKDVWVHKFICAGTLEERIDEMIESKKALAESVIGSGEGWLTELDTEQLRQLVTLSQEAIGD
ncbi:MAG TPA: DEAD/DEAH box helicase, partial [Chloroflexi bacterium]|nr:DEAD/DEAH box helicase [Chloroflexota bacterium]